MMKVVIVGSGIAGITAAKTIRQHDPDAAITVYTAELQNGLYARKDMARRLAAGTLSLESLYIEDEAALARQGIQVIYDPVLRLFARYGQVLVNHSIRKPYDRALIAVGATPRVVEAPGTHLLGVHQARIYEDFSFLENWLADFREAGAVVVGGGVLGMDMAYALSARGVPTTLVAREARLGLPWLGEAEAQQAEAALRARGVTIRYGETVAAFLSEDDRVLDGVQLSGGQTLPARLALCAVGVAPSTDFLEDSGIELDETTGAVVVNARLQTNFEQVYAAGSCALIAGQIAYNWALAAEQGRVAALNMLGQEAMFDASAIEAAVRPLVLEDVPARI